LKAIAAMRATALLTMATIAEARANVATMAAGEGSNIGNICSEGGVGGD
jgi:hypothetical protein